MLRQIISAVATVTLACLPTLGCQVRGDRIMARRAMWTENASLVKDSGLFSCAGVEVLRDIPYGNDAQQRFDVYRPKGTVSGAPVIFMVHGGAWFLGDKAADAAISNKVARWVPKGFVIISTNYRMLPQATPLEQAEDVARALAAAQDKAASWGADRSRFILMGHSAGAHLVALLAVSPSIAARHGASAVLGSVFLDSAAYDIERIMLDRHARFYDRAFGSDPAYWRAASPAFQVKHGATPFLAVCSTRREDACSQAAGFADKATALGIRTEVLAQDLSHKDVNQRLGEEGFYTLEVEAFLSSLDPLVARALENF